MIVNLPAVVDIASWALAGAFLVHQIVYGVGDAPKGCDPRFWARSLRYYRHQRARRREGVIKA